MVAAAGASAAGLTQFEREREARIAANKARLAALMEGADTSLLQAPAGKPRGAAGPRCPAARRERAAAQPGELRRSNRISNAPTPLYCIEEDANDAAGGRRRRASLGGGGGGGGGPNGRRCHGARSVVIGGDPHLAAPAGWKPECGSASLAAAEAATDAALELVQRLQASGRPAYIKLMSASQVSGGFWSQLPFDIGPHYGLSAKRTVTLHCFGDRAHLPPEEFLYNSPGSSTAWPVVFLPKGDGGGCGLSGGWRGFAIDQRLHPNDTVVFEVLDEAPPAFGGKPKAAAGGGGADGSSSSAAAPDDAALNGASACSDGGGFGGPGGSNAGRAAAAHRPEAAAAAAAAAAACSIKPHQRMHMLAHLFRAARFEQEDVAIGSQRAQHQPGSSAEASERRGSGEQGQAPGDADADVPLAKRRQLLAGGTAGWGPGTPPAAAHAAERGDVAWRQRDQGVVPGASPLPLAAAAAVLPPTPEQEVIQRLGLMGAAEAGFLPVKVGRQAPATVVHAGDMGADEPAAAAAAASGAAAGGGPGARSHGARSSGPEAGAAVPLVRSRPAQARQAKARGEEQENEGRRRSSRSRRGPAVAGSRGAPARGQRQQQQQQEQVRAQKPQWRGKKRRQQDAGEQEELSLVPKPANPEELVSPPTQEERRRDAAGGPFWVRKIVGHRVGPGSGEDEFLVRWWGFSEWWDSWEPTSCLDAAPGTYPWQGGAVPAKFRLP